MRTIHKYPIVLDDDTNQTGFFSLKMPASAEILCLQTQFQHPYLWALVDTDAPLRHRRFFVLCTGTEITTDVGRYVGTFELSVSHVVLHLFEGQDVPTPHSHPH